MTTLCFIDTETTGLDPERHEIWEVACILRRPIEEHLRDLPPAEGRRLEGAKWVDSEYVWQLPVDLARADTIALNIGHFMERRWRFIPSAGNHANALDGLQDPAKSSLVKTPLMPEQMERWAEQFAALTWGAHLIGCVPSFDETRLERLLRRLGSCVAASGLSERVETMAAGYVIGFAKGIARAALSGVQARIDRLVVPASVPSIGQFGGALQRQDAARLPIDSEEISRAMGVQPDHFERHSALGDARWACAIWDRIHSIGDPA